MKDFFTSEDVIVCVNVTDFPEVLLDEILPFSGLLALVEFVITPWAETAEATFEVTLKVTLSPTIKYDLSFLSTEVEIEIFLLAANRQVELKTNKRIAFIKSLIFFMHSWSDINEKTLVFCIKKLKSPIIISTWSNPTLSRNHFKLPYLIGFGDDKNVIIFGHYNLNAIKVWICPGLNHLF